MHDWGWRLPFPLGLLISPVGMYDPPAICRKRMKAGSTAASARCSCEHGRTLLLGMLLMTGSTSSMYIMVF
ncbi:hypothetical protein ACU4GD_08400 [Cupriavidus basilensis]